MQRYLYGYTIIHTALLVALILILCCFNIYIAVSRQKSPVIALFHIASGFFTVALIALLMDVVILQLPFEQYFKQAFYVFALLGTLVGTVAIYGIFLMGKDWKAHGGNVKAANLKAVFAALPDLVLVGDYQGKIVAVNVPDRLGALCENPTTLEDVSRACDAQLTKEGVPRYKQQVLPICVGGEILGYTAFLQDITDIHVTEQALEASYQDLLIANQKLKASVNIAGVLEAEEARFQLLEAVQKGLVITIEDAIGHIRQLPKCADHEFEKNIIEVATILRSAYRDVRESVREISEKGKL